MLKRLFKSKAEVEVLGVVLFKERLHLREIARQANITPSETKRELDNLVKLGILKKEKKGNLVLFYTNKKCPFLNELQNLYLKTDGIYPILKKELSYLNLKFAIVYGSMAKGNFDEKSDIDILLIGEDINEDKLIKTIMKTQKKTNREINYILWNEKELREKIKNKGAFINSVLKEPKIMLIGDENEFKRS